MPRDVWVLSAATFVNRSGTMVLPFLSLYLTEARGYSVAQAGTFIAVYGVGSLAGSYLGGWMSDRLGPVRTQQISLLGTGIGYLWIARLGGAVEIAVALFLTSVVAEGFRPAVMASIAERTPDGLEARSFALLRQAVNLGFGIGPAVGGFLAERDFAWLFVVDALTCWLAAGVLAVTLTPRPAGHAGREPRRAHDRPPWKDGPFLCLMALVFVMSAVLFQLFGTVPVYFREAYGLPKNGVGLLLGFNAFLILVFEMVLTHWSERRNRLALIGAGFFLLCAGLGMMPLGTSAAFAASTIVVWSVGEMLCLPLLNAVVAGRAGPAHRGRYLGVYTMTFSLALVVGPAGGTWVYEHVGPDALWAGIAALGVPLGLGAAALVGPFRRRPQPPPEETGADLPVAR